MGAGGNPAFKIYDVDPDTYEIMDARVYMSTTLCPHLSSLLIPGVFSECIKPHIPDDTYVHPA